MGPLDKHIIVLHMKTQIGKITHVRLVAQWPDVVMVVGRIQVWDQPGRKLSFYFIL